LPVLEASGEGAVCLAIGGQWHDHTLTSATVDATGRDRLAYAGKDLAADDSWVADKMAVNCGIPMVSDSLDGAILL
jgi:hypothetical protein